jgi:transcriptional regulator with XRE-family HTH domain
MLSIMQGGQIIREARRRANLTQRELAGRVGTTQSAIARIERGATEPSYDRVRQLLQACGFELVPRIAPLDDSNWSVASSNLGLTPEERVRHHQAWVRLVREGRGALARARA